MIQKIRNRFILSAMLSITIVMLVILTAIIGINYASLIKESDTITDFLSENGGTFPDRPPLQLETDEMPPEPASETPGIDANSADLRQEPPFRGDGDRRFDNQNIFNAETRYITRFFTVTLDNDCNVLSTNTGNVAAIEAAEAQSYAASVFSSGKIRGFKGSYRFLRADRDSSTMLIFVDCSTRLTSFRRLVFTCIIVGFAGLAAFLLLTFLLSGQIIRPVSDSYARQKQFVTDAGHEIRTPLSVIDANTQVIEMMYGEDEWTQSTRRQIKRLTALTNELIALSRMEEAPNTAAFTSVSLSLVIEECAKDFESLAEGAGNRIRTDIEPGLTVSGDEKSLRQLFSILFDNAVKYTPEGKTVRAKLTRKNRNLQFTISNPCTGIEKGSQNHLFDRFYRGDSSRSTKGGYGIGLAIARAICEKHSAKISAESPDGASLVITILF